MRSHSFLRVRVRSSWVPVLGLLAAAVAVLLVVAAPSAAAQSSAAAEQLAEKYVPITMLREQTDPPCQTTAEQYEPTSVETVLGNPTVELKPVSYTHLTLPTILRV